MTNNKQTVAEALADIRTNLQYLAEHLRRFDEETADRIARRLDRLRYDLRSFAENASRDS